MIIILHFIFEFYVTDNRNNNNTDKVSDIIYIYVCACSYIPYC